MSWQDHSRPGYFGRRRDQKVDAFDEKFGSLNWRLVWKFEGENLEFYQACKLCYEQSYFLYLKERPQDLEFICSHADCIDNAQTNILSGLNYNVQEAYSTHLQDIAIRNVLASLNLSFKGPPDKILTIRSKDSEGFRFGPGNVPFLDPALIEQPSLCPSWASPGSVEDFWQSNKWLQILSQQEVPAP